MKKPSAQPYLPWCLAAALAAALSFRALEIPQGVLHAQAGQDSRAVEGVQTSRDLSAAFKSASRAVKPSVVSINSTKILKPGRRSPDDFDGPSGDLFGDDFWERFFGRGGPREGFKQTGLGSGLIVSPDGHILTNNHVVAGADEVSVKIGPDRELPAKVIGTDPKTDLAVIKVDARDLSPAPFGDSDQLEVGEWVLAMGNAFGLAESLTAGIVSATGRVNLNIVDYEDFIQTDAAINPGNSGGPLFNLNGKVVGINTAIFSRSGGFMGIGFAIPINMARKVMESIIKEGRVVRGFLGVNIQDLTPGLARSFGYDGKEGALIASVAPCGPAEKAGLQEGDIITEIHSARVADSTQLRNIVAALRPGAKVPVKVFREGKLESMEVEIGGQKPEEPAAPAREASTDLGMAVKTLTPDLANQLGIDEALRGIVVTAIEPGSIADKAGLRPRDIILGVQGTPVPNVGAFRREMEKAESKEGYRFKVQRGRTVFFIFVKPNAP